MPSTYTICRNDAELKPGLNLRGTLYQTGSAQSAIRRAVNDLEANAIEGQYAVTEGLCDYLGYAIKYKGEQAYFELDPVYEDLAGFTFDFPVEVYNG